MFRVRVLAVGALLAIGTATVLVATAFGGSDDGSSGGRQIALRDDCDPNGGWDMVPGGCALRRGDVSVAEFDEELPVEPPPAPLTHTLIGHQAWRFDPPYLKIEEGTTVRVRNRGGRPHTFTQVEHFGGGYIPPLNVNLVPAPECLEVDPAEAELLPGDSTRVTGLSVGNHRFQCCIHPWQRALIKVLPDEEDEDEDDGD
jgi:plastocyanin